MHKLLVVLSILTTTNVYSEARFIGDVYLKDNKKDGVHLRLLKKVEFVDKNDEIWMTPAGYETDGASIPRWAWTAVGSPFTGKYLRSAIIHDYACDVKDRDWRKVHRTFYEAMLVDGVDPIQAKTMYAAVYHKGPRWDFQKICSAKLLPGLFSWSDPIKLPVPCNITDPANPYHEIVKTHKNVEIEVQEVVQDIHYAQPSDNEIDLLKKKIALSEKNKAMTIEDIEQFKFQQ